MRRLGSIALVFVSSGCVDRVIVDDTAVGSATSGDSAVDSISDTAASSGREPEPIPPEPEPIPPEPPPVPPVEPDLIYANTPTTLYTVDLAGRDIRPVGDFSGQAFGERITDIAVDDLGVLYAVSTSQLYQCDAVTVECEALAAIEGANAAAFLSVPELADVSMLYLATSFGEWIRVDVYAKPVTIEYLGTLWSETEGAAVSDGDIATVFDETGVPVHVISVDFDSGLNGRIRQVDPSTGFLGPMAGLGYQGTDDLWGLVQFQGVVYAFSPSSLIYSSAGVVDINEVSRPEWWGASADGASL